MPPGPWPYVRQGPKGLETYYIPNQLDQIRRLPEPDRSHSLGTIGKHEANLNFLRSTMGQFFPAIRSGKSEAVLEYTMDLSEVMMGVDLFDLHFDNPLYPHEPLLKALPSYTRVQLLTPRSVQGLVQKRLEALGLSSRVRIVVSKELGSEIPEEGITRWVRDLVFPARRAKDLVLLVPFTHKRYQDVSNNDLTYLRRMDARGRHLLRVPALFNGGNLTIISKGGRKTLLLGKAELDRNNRWFVELFGFSPPTHAIPDILEAAAGVDGVEILPNSPHLFHLDMFLVPLGDGVVGILAPEDPERMVQADRDVLGRAISFFKGAGFQVVPIPTSTQRMEKYQSATNVVIFTDRQSGRRRALVPQYPEPPGQNGASSLNAKLLNTYRGLGIDPIPVEDRFHPLKGNIHCAMLPLH